MLLARADGSDLWLAYCMNVHPGGGVEAARAALDRTVVPLRDRLGVTGPFGVGLRFDAAAVAALSSDGALREGFAGHLATLGLVPFTANGFVLGAFHGRAVKESVYAPTWRQEERLRYTLDLALVMADLARRAGGTSRVSISTAPLAWRRGCEAVAERREGARAIARAARRLADLADETGVVVRLGIEPEPGCLLDTTPGVAAFLAEDVREALGPHEAALAHVGVCYDVCHQAVMHEEVAPGLEHLATRGVAVVKAQASCALEVADPADGTRRAALMAFDEPVYLHQVGARDGHGRLHLAGDLGEALAPGSPFAALAPWRVHFHVPVFRRRLAGGLGTTARHLDHLLAAVARRGVTDHLEIETYSFDVLPREEREAGSGFDLLDALEQEYRAVLATLAAHGTRLRRGGGGA